MTEFTKEQSITLLSQATHHQHVHSMDVYKLDGWERGRLRHMIETDQRIVCEVSSRTSDYLLLTVKNPVA